MTDSRPDPLDQKLREIAQAARPDVSAFVAEHVAAMCRAGASAQLTPPRSHATPRRSRLVRRFSTRALVAGATLAVFVSSASAAYVGVLPAPAQDAAADVARSVGVDIPHGATVRKVAQDPTLSGRQKGAAVSAVASVRGREASAGNSASVGKAAPPRADQAQGHGQGNKDRPKRVKGAAKPPVIGRGTTQRPDARDARPAGSPRAAAAHPAATNRAGAPRRRPAPPARAVQQQVPPASARAGRGHKS